MKNLGRIVAVIQARMGSKRLPNKMMLHLNGYPIIEWVLRRVNESKEIGDIVVAVPNGDSDDILSDYIEQIGGKIYRGCENDVLGRVYEAAVESKADTLVRICADNPLVSASELDELVARYRKSDADYMYNHIPKLNCYPDGIGGEIVSMELAQELMLRAKMPDEREHMFNFIWNNPEEFSIETFSPDDKLLWRPDLKMDIDTYRDYGKLLRTGLTIDSSARAAVRLISEHSDSEAA